MVRALDGVANVLRPVLLPNRKINFEARDE